MIARVARWNPFPDTPWVTEVASGVPGIRAIYHVVDDRDGSGLSISFADDEEVFGPTTEAILAENARRGADGFSGSPTEVTTYRVKAYSVVS